MLTWLSNNGTTWPLDGSSGVTTTANVDGVFTIPTDLLVDQRVGGDGGVVVSQRRSPRRIILPLLLVDEASAGGVGSLWKHFLTALAVGGRLVYNSTFTLYNVVLEGPDGNGTGYDLSRRPDDWFTVSLLAMDPWWLDDGWQHTLPIGQATDFNASIAFNAAIPFNGGTTTRVQILGDAPSAPVVEVTGPITELTVGTSEGVWELAAPLAAGEMLLVRHTPGGRFYTSSAGKIGPMRLGGQIDWSLLTERSDLFGLDVGITTIFVQGSGTDANSRVRFLYHQKFLTPGSDDAPPTSEESTLVEDPPGSGLYAFTGSFEVLT